MSSPRRTLTKRFGKRLLRAHEQEFYAKIHRLMLEALRLSGITRAELARRMGVTSARVTQLLAKPQNVNLNTVVKVFMHLGVTPTFVMKKVKR